MRHLRWLGPAAVLVGGAVVLVAALVLGGSDQPPTTTEPGPVALESSSAHQWFALDQLVAASPLVVRAHVVDTRRGEVLGADGPSPAVAGVVVREVTLEVDEVWRHTSAAAPVEPGERLVVAEEGWLSSGEPIVVDGLAPSTAGDDAVWFRQPLPGRTADGADVDAGSPRFLVAGSQGRYLVGAGGSLTGAEGDDRLVGVVEALTLDQLRAELRD